MCRVPDLNHSVYCWRDREPSAKDVENERLLKRMTAIHAASRGSYRSPKVWRKLCLDGQVVNHKRAARLMRDNAPPSQTGQEVCAHD